jgi:hypothetical protein
LATDVLYRSRRAWGYLLLLAAVTIAVRLPQLLSVNLLLDGDECVVGLMGLHVLRRLEFPLVMYGQPYGLAIVEAPAAAIAFALFGAGAVPLKLAIVALWIGGLALYFLAFSRMLGAARSFWLTLLIALMPAWAVASMKAWSGYVTAFAATAAAVYLVADRDSRRRAPWLAAGITTAAIYVAQPLWLPGLLPFVLYSLVSAPRRRWIAYGAGAFGGAIVVAAIRTWWIAGAVPAWTGPSVGNSHLLASLRPVIDQVYVSLTGSYFLGNVVAPGRVTAAVAWFWTGVLGLAIVAQAYRFATRRYLAWSHVLFASVALTIAANWMLLENRDGRYMLPLSVPLVFLAGVECFDLADRFHVPMRRCVAAILLLAVVHGAAMREFAGYTFMWWTNAADSPSEANTLRKVVGTLRSRGVSRAYAMNALLQWTITFYSDETVIARWKGARDRYPPYISAVDAALDAGEPIAIVGYAGYTYGLERRVRDPESILVIDGKYFVYFGADRALLQQAGFRLTR